MSINQIQHNRRVRVLKDNPNLTSEEAGVILGCSRAVIQNVRKKEGLPNSQKPSHNAVLLKSDLPQLLELLKFMKGVDIADKWGVTLSALSQFLTNHGHSLCGIRRKIKVDFVVNNLTMNVYDIAAELDCSINTVYKIKREL